MTTATTVPDLHGQATVADGRGRGVHVLHRVHRPMVAGRVPHRLRRHGRHHPGAAARRPLVRTRRRRQRMRLGPRADLGTAAPARPHLADQRQLAIRPRPRPSQRDRNPVQPRRTARRPWSNFNTDTSTGSSTARPCTTPSTKPAAAGPPFSTCSPVPLRRHHRNQHRSNRLAHARNARRAELRTGGHADWPTTSATCIRYLGTGLPSWHERSDEIWVPEACTLPIVERPLRLAEFDTCSPHRCCISTVSPTSLRWRLDPAAEATARDLTVRESDCCSFFSFASPSMVTYSARCPGAVGAGPCVGRAGCPARLLWAANESRLRSGEVAAAAGEPPDVALLRAARDCWPSRTAAWAGTGGIPQRR